MNEVLRDRIQRKLDNLPDETAYQVLDYLDFLETRYGTGERTASPFQRLAEGLEDTLRAGRVPVSAIKGTMDVVGAAGRLMRNVAAAGRAAVDEFERMASTSTDLAPSTPSTGDIPDKPLDSKKTPG